MTMVLCLGVFPAHKVNASDTVADVEAELTVDKTEVILGDEDEIKDEWALDEGGYYRLYQETVDITLTVQGKVESIYSNAYVQFDYQTIYMSYDSSSSTERTTVYKGYVFVNQYTPYDETYVLEAQLQRTENGQLEKVNCPAATVKVTRSFSDSEGPKLVNLVIDRQGETIKDGKIEITAKVSDIVGMDEGDDAVSVLLASSLGEVKYVDLQAQGDGTYKATIDVEKSGLSECKWYIDSVTLYDTVRNKTKIEYGQESLYYFYIDKDGNGGTNTNPSTPSTDNNKPSTDDNKDTNTNTSTNTSTNTNANTNQNDKTTTDTKVPQTGDNNSVMIYMVVCLVALAAIVADKSRRQKM